MATDAAGMQAPATGAAAQPNGTHAHEHTLSTELFKHTPHLHVPRNVNALHEAEKAAGNFNKKVAMGLTNIFQAMPTFWLIMAWFVIWIVANATIVSFDPMPWQLLLVLASIPQLPLMIVIMVGQGLLGRKQELQADEQFQTTQSTYHDIEQVMQHLSAQDAELIKQTQMLVRMLQNAGISPDTIVAAGSTLATRDEAASAPDAAR